MMKYRIGMFRMGDNMVKKIGTDLMNVWTKIVKQYLSI